MDNKMVMDIDGGRFYRYENYKFWLRLVIYYILLLFVGPYFGNWTSTEKYLCRIDVYSSECSIDECIGPSTNEFRCIKQGYMIARLGTICNIFAFSAGLLFGIFMDKFGPRLTFIIGIILRIISWLIFSIPNVNNYFIILSVILLGISRNALVYPTLTLYLYTNYYKELSTTIMGIGVTTSSVYIMLLERCIGYFNFNPYITTFISLLSTHIPCFIIGSIIFPKYISNNFNISSTSSNNIKNSINSNHPTTPLELEILDNNIKDVDIENNNIKECWDKNEFIRLLIEMRYIIICIYFVMNLLSFIFIHLLYTTMYGIYKNNLILNEYLNMFSFILTLIIGFLYNYIQPLTIIIYFNIIGLISHFIALYPTNIAGIFVSITHNIVGSVLFSQMNIYIQTIYNHKYFGSLVGFINTICGITLVFNFILINLVEQYNIINYIHYLFISIRIIFTLTLTQLYNHTNKKIIIS